MKIGSKIKKISLGLSVALLLFLGLAHTPDYFEISKNLDIFNAIYRELNIAYVDGTKPGKLMKTGLDAMLNSLDPYTVYYAENEIEDYRYITTGEYGGIGATVNDIEGKIIIDEPREGFAAFKAGIRAGDQIIGVNGINVEGKKSDDITNLLRGNAGTTIKLKLIKLGEKTPVELSLLREEIKSPAVPFSGMMPNGKTGFIKLVAFTENCSAEVREALLDLKSKGCQNLVLDLRGNLGGLLHEAVNIVNLFIDKGQEVVFTKGKVSEWDKSYLAVYNPVDIKIPLLVMVDENSASASEIVSGALQDLDRAVVIGKRTYGKGLVQQTKDLVYQTKVKITVAKYYIPSGRCVQALDYSHKDELGRVEKVPDSLITAFKTKGGRIVYDGAGIMPDIKTNTASYSQLLQALDTKYHIFNYATDYFLKHKEIVAPKDFALTDDEYMQFVEYLKNKDLSYKSFAEMQLEAIKKQAIDEKNYEGFKSEMEALTAKLESNKKEDLMKQKEEIKNHLAQEIVTRYYFQKGKVEYNMKNDKEVEEAIKYLSDADKMLDVLTRIEKPTKRFNSSKKF